MNMNRWLPGLALAGTVGVIAAGRWRERAVAAEVARSLRSTPCSSGRRVDFAELATLPAPVARYFRHVLTDGSPVVRAVTLLQTGHLRTSTTSGTWRPFTAEQLVMPGAPGFLWNAKVSLPPGLHVRVLDSYHAGIGAGRVSLLSLLRLGADAGRPELNASALQRYLAEAAWYPTALLPSSGVAWTPIDEHSACATLTSHGISVCMEFRFNAADEIAGIYTQGRFRSVVGGYRLTAWEGHLSDYVLRAGLRVPTRGEVGWYDGGQWEAVWKGKVTEARFEFEQAASRQR
jgi:hypothetical protein